MPDSSLEDHILLRLKLYKYLTRFKSLIFEFMKEWQQTIFEILLYSGSYIYCFAFVH